MARMFRGCRVWLVLGWLVPVVVGCGAPTGAARDAALPPFGPHGGVVVALGEPLGVAEIWLEPRGDSAFPSRVSVCARLTREDLATLTAELPSRLAVRVDFPDREPTEVELVLDPGAAKPGVYRGPPGDYLVEPLCGELSVESTQGRLVQSFRSPR